MSDAAPFLVEACPECDSCRITRRQQRDHPQSRGTGWYRCSSCETAFDEPVEREPKGARSTVSTALRRADPDALDDVLGGDGR